MKNLLLGSMAALAILAFLISPAEALWSQQFNESGVGNFDFMRIDLISGLPFEEPALSGFTDPSGSTDASWAQLWNTGMSAAASGNEVNTLNFFINLGGDQTQPVSFYFTSYDIDPTGAATLLDSAKADWIDSGNGYGWVIALAQWDPGTSSPANPVPEPATLLLLGSGLVGLAGFSARRFAKK